MYKTLALAATAMLLATTAQADWPDGANDSYGDQGSPSQMSDSDFYGAIADQGSLYSDAGASSSGKDTSEASAGKGDHRDDNDAGNN